MSQSAEVVSTPSDETSDSWWVGAVLDEAAEDLSGETAGGRTAMKKWVSKRRGRRVGVLHLVVVTQTHQSGKGGHHSRFLRRSASKGEVLTPSWTNA